MIEYHLPSIFETYLPAILAILGTLLLCVVVPLVLLAFKKKEAAKETATGAGILFLFVAVLGTTAVFAFHDQITVGQSIVTQTQDYLNNKYQVELSESETRQLIQIQPTDLYDQFDEASDKHENNNIYGTTRSYANGIIQSLELVKEGQDFLLFQSASEQLEEVPLRD